jgi:Vitamin B12 dependent methionine synthase, activation domain
LLRVLPATRVKGLVQRVESLRTYPAYPNLNDQQSMWTLLMPQDIGVELTDGFMMDPEASLSALIFHHPDCVYFRRKSEVGSDATVSVGSRFSRTWASRTTDALW